MKKVFTLALKKNITQSFYLALLFSLTVYLWVRILLFDIPFTIAEDGSIVIKMLFTCWAIIVSCRLGFNSLYFIALNRQQILNGSIPVKNKLLQLVTGITIVAFLTGCNGRIAVGIKKDLNTGMTTNYNGISIEDSKIIMNDEVLNHTDIPIGESFVIVNEGIEGLTVKDDKVAVGCSLEIIDENGKVLLSEPDLFKDVNAFNKDSVQYLRCAVNTGAPMQWEENYIVKTVFTDKYGTGRIENEVMIRMIDVP